ncbi:MAG: MotA/TolQ/ExbB proton channel family protein [Nitrospirae bacterium]|nr:MotA/TolQ/ExbB proton channel family protein [Nitrospirota bacterium]
MRINKGLQPSTPLGLAIGMISIVGAIVIEFNHMNPDFGSAFLKISPIMIIFGGTYGATMLSFPVKDMLQVPRLFFMAFSQISIDKDDLTNTLVNWAQRARRGGILQLESDLAALDNAFIYKGLRMIIDGVDPKLVREVLENNVSRMEQRHNIGSEVWGSMGGYAPTMGIIGTVVGLIAALSEAGAAGGEGASKVVGAIATAFIATFYGILSANILFLPIQRKLKARSENERFMLEVAMEGLLSLQQGEHPTYIQDRVNSFFAFKREEEGRAAAAAGEERKAA